MKLNSLKELYLHELGDLYDAEQQLTKALPKMVKGAASIGLKSAFEQHLAQTEVHVERLERVFDLFGEKPKRVSCKGMKGLLEEGEEMLKQNGDSAVKDAALIAAAQRVEHYEIAGYGCARTYAEMLGEAEGVRLLDQTLGEEKETDTNLTALAQSTINLQAASA